MQKQIFYGVPSETVTRFTEDKKRPGFNALDDIDGIAQKNARMWQIIALVSLSSVFIALGIIIYAVNLPKTIPVVVTVDSEGHANYAGKIDKSLYGRDAIPENAKIYQMKRLIRNMYIKVVDRDAQDDYIKEAGAIVQSTAAKLLDEHYRNENPFADFGKFTQSVEIEDPLKQTDKTYFVNFSVSRTNRDGYVVWTRNFTALINLEFYESVPESNPLGIFITNFDIKEK